VRAVILVIIEFAVRVAVRDAVEALIINFLAIRVLNSKEREFSLNALIILLNASFGSGG